VSEQPPPIPNGGADVWALCISDAMKRGDRPRLVALRQRRREIGIARYGTPLQVGNGRDNLRDATEEALDLEAYTRAEMERHPGDGAREAANALARHALDLLDAIAEREGQ
jgi:hypothetical protein